MGAPARRSRGFEELRPRVRSRRLFTLGAGHYAEHDARQAARAFTGWVRQDPRGGFLAETPTFVRDKTQVDDGT